MGCTARTNESENVHGEPMELDLDLQEGVELEEQNAKVNEEIQELMRSLQLWLHPARGSQHRQATPMSNMWALLVAIENYQVAENVPNDAPGTHDALASRSGDDPPEVPHGALQDVQSVYEYLVRERGVPESQIVVLRDEQATRANIIETFQKHLTHNQFIARDDPILFYFAGHGSHDDAPSGWVGELEGDETQEKPQIEYIVPYDSLGPDGQAQPGIPDRTTRALIHDLAQRKGRNISVVLDCCHSGNGVRKGSEDDPNPWRARGVKPQYIGKLQTHTDSELWKQTEAHPGIGAGISSSLTARCRDDDTHVLLAACTRFESAQGCAVLGGVFTSTWLSVLREGRARTYAEALVHIRSKLGEFYKLLDSFYALYPNAFPSDRRLEKQNPQCEGFNRDRLLFANKSERSRDFTVQAGADNTECVVIGTGISYGVKQGTMFELRHRHGEKSIVLGSAVAQEVYADSCVAKLPQGLLLPDYHVRAVISKLSDPVKFDTKNGCPESSKATHAFELLNSKLAAESPYYERISDEKAELVLEVDDKFVHFKRQDIRLSTIDTPSPKLPVDNIGRIADVMKGVAHFNYYLSFESESHPFATHVDVRLHELERADVTYGTSDYTLADQCRNLKAGQPVPWENGEASILHEHDEQLYALVLRSTASQPLFAYVLLFDPATYAIDVFAQPLNADDPALKPNKPVQFGRSSECEDALWFDLGEDNKKDTGYMKIILATEGHLNLSFMEQPPVLGGDLNHSSDHARTMGSTGNAPQPMKGVWDIITRKLTVFPVKID